MKVHNFDVLLEMAESTSQKKKFQRLFIIQSQN